MLHLKRSYNKSKYMRYYANVAIKDDKVHCPAMNRSNAINTNTESNDDVKNFDDIPGPTGLFGIGTFYHYMPIIGKYTWTEIHKAGFDKHNKYGDIVKERMVPGVDVVWLFDPNDIAKVVNNTGPDLYPQRRSHLGLKKYRTDRPHIYKTAGLIPTNGSEWWRLRSEFQKGLSAPKHIRQFLNNADAITKDFVTQMQRRNVETMDFLPELSRLNLELVCYLAFDIRMESFTEKQRQSDSRSSRLIQASEDANSCILSLDQGIPIWHFIETPTYRKFRLAQEYLESVAIDLVNKKMSNLNAGADNVQNRSRRSLLDDYLLNPKLDLADVITMACDVLLTGVDTTTYSTCFLLYQIARHPDVQARVFQEAYNVLPNFESNEITADQMANQLSYCKAVLKETLRLNPVSVGIGRITNTDLILSGYKVPKETIIVTQNFVSCRSEKYFKLPDQFWPERWMKSTNEMDSKTLINPYLVLPFGYGTRSCIARRFAEQNMLVLMIRLIRKYEIGWNGVDELNITTETTINKPSSPIMLTFKERSI